MNSRIALASLVGVIAITVADAPDWRMRPYLGFLGAMTATSFVAAADRTLGESLALLVLGTILLRRGEDLGRAAQRTLNPSSSGGSSGKVVVPL